MSGPERASEYDWDLEDALEERCTGGRRQEMGWRRLKVGHVVLA